MLPNGRGHLLETGIGRGGVHDMAQGERNGVVYFCWPGNQAANDADLYAQALYGRKLSGISDSS